jgi:Tfp pilus assembly protein PilX
MSVLQRSPATRRPVRGAAGLGLPERLRDESGIALIMALAVMLVLTVLVTATLAFTSFTSRDASLKQSGQSAYSLAEAALSQAKAQLYVNYYDTSGNPKQNTTAYDPTWFTASGIPSSQQSPTSTAACTSTSTCMSWSPQSWTATNSANVKGILVLQGTGRVPNPTGGAQLTRTVTDKIFVEQLPYKQTPGSEWDELYSGATGNTCDLQLGQSVNANAPIYVAGNLCLTSTAKIEGSTDLTKNVTLTVLGNIRIQNGNNSDIGAGTPLTSVQVGGGCIKDNSKPFITPCPINLKNSQQIFDNSGRTTAPVPTATPLPTIDWTTTASELTAPAATISCTNGVSISTLSTSTFYLTPGSGAGSTGYTCTIKDSVSGQTVGSIVYNSSAHTLAFSGEVYFPGNLDLSNSTPVTYTGLGNFFVAGTVTAANGTTLCVHVASGACDVANANTKGNADYWDTSQSVLIIQAQGMISSTNLSFQGGLYSVTEINLGGGQGSTQGPLVSPNLIIPGQSLNLSFPNFPWIFSGSLGTNPPPYQLFSSGGSF